MLVPPVLSRVVSAAPGREEKVRSFHASSEPIIPSLKTPLHAGEWLTAEHSSVQEDIVRSQSETAPPIREECPVAD